MGSSHPLSSQKTKPKDHPISIYLKYLLRNYNGFLNPLKFFDEILVNSNIQVNQRDRQLRIFISVTKNKSNNNLFLQLLSLRKETKVYNISTHMFD